jgi:hypothetical protein|tara:strand:+ start:69 stop:566 length:498 start_codon:yes stop_codon:yes gene_type:complete
MGNKEYSPKQLGSIERTIKIGKILVEDYPEIAKVPRAISDYFGLNAGIPDEKQIEDIREVVYDWAMAVCELKWPKCKPHLEVGPFLWLLERPYKFESVRCTRSHFNDGVGIEVALPIGYGFESPGEGLRGIESMNLSNRIDDGGERLPQFARRGRYHLGTRKNNK